MPLVSLTRATLRRAEFGFLGVVVYTRVHTPRRWGAPLRAGVLVFVDFDSRPFRTSCWMVGMAIELYPALPGSPDPKNSASSSREAAASPSPSPSPVPMLASQAARSWS